MTEDILGNIVSFKKNSQKRYGVGNVEDNPMIPDDMLTRNIVSARKISNNSNPRGIRNTSLQNEDSNPSCTISDTKIPYRPRAGDSIANEATDIKGIYDVLGQQLSQTEMTNALLDDIKQGVRSPQSQPIALYNTGRVTINVATPNQVSSDQISDNVTTPGYVTENVNNAMGRNAYKAYVINRGPGDLYLIYSSGGNIFGPNEALLLEGATEILFNVYEIRLRSPTIGCQYEVTEYEVPLQGVNTVKAEKVETYSTVSTVHFTGAIPFQAQQTTDVNGLPYNRIIGNKYYIRGVNIQSVQPLIYNLIFYTSNNPYNTAGILDTDTFIDHVELDLSQPPAYRIANANQWKLNVSDLNVVYEDTDNTLLLHLGLQNLSPVAKLAGAAGAVQLDFKCSPRL